MADSSQVRPAEGVNVPLLSQQGGGASQNIGQPKRILTVAEYENEVRTLASSKMRNVGADKVLLLTLPLIFSLIFLSMGVSEDVLGATVAGGVVTGACTLGLIYVIGKNAFFGNVRDKAYEKLNELERALPEGYQKKATELTDLRKNLVHDKRQLAFCQKFRKDDVEVIQHYETSIKEKEAQIAKLELELQSTYLEPETSGAYLDLLECLEKLGFD